MQGHVQHTRSVGAAVGQSTAVGSDPGCCSLVAICGAVPSLQRQACGLQQALAIVCIHKVLILTLHVTWLWSE